MKIEAIPFEELAVGKQADGLIPAIVQDDRTLQVLMLGYMNREAYEKSQTEGFIRRLQAVVRQRHAAMPEGSYTARLFTHGVNKIAQKVGEEAVETVIEAVAGNREAMIYEASDLVYHLLVLLEATGCSIADLERELSARHA